MTILLWILQVVLALHTAMGAFWRFSNPAPDSLKTLTPPLWMSLSAVELACTVALMLPLFYRPAALGAPIAASVLAAEMLLFVALHLASGAVEHGQMYYWLVVAALCTTLAIARFRA